MDTPDLKPNFVIAGAARSGTTALAYALDQHPDVFVSNPKEVHFLAFAGNRPEFTGPGDSETVSRALITDPDEYAQLFAGSSGFTARGEGSVTTLYHPEKSIDSIGRYMEADTKVVAVLREPAARTFSSYMYLRSRGFEPFDDFGDALRAEPDRIADGYQHLWHLRAMSRYSEQLPLFVDKFGDNLLVLIQEEYMEDQQRSLERVADFLGVDSSYEFDTGLEVNRGGEPRSALFNSAVSALRANPVTQSMIKRLVPRSAREKIRLASLAPSQAPAAEMAELRTEFEPDRVYVEQLLGRPIPHWRDQ